MKKMLRFGFLCGLLTVFVGTVDGIAATKKQSAIQAGTKVRAKVEATGVYDQDCYDKYFGCMDNFCIVDNENGGSCSCSDESKKYEAQLEDIRKTLSEAERISTEGVEIVQAGANADIIFGSGERIYNADGSVEKLRDKNKKEEANAIKWTSIYDEDDEEEELWNDSEEFADKTGKALYDSANKLCKEQMPTSCSKDMKLLIQMYSRQITSDCKGLSNSIAQQKQEADNALKTAHATVRGALKESLAESNKYNRGECMVEFRKCMQGSDACGSDWEKCVFTIASENMQNNEAVSTAGTKVETITTYDITASTMGILESKRFICERVLDSCVAVRDYVWDDFLRESAPVIRLAEQNAESKKRESCMDDISACIQRACKADIVGKGKADMDACLARPDMARSFCKVQIDPCERMDPGIWDYVVAKLNALRVDACTQEVKDCIMSEDRCGPDFMNCIGMDFNFIRDICPIDKLVACKQNNKKFSMSDLDSMLMGFYLNIDKKALENCQNLVDKKMIELCGSTTDCNAFLTDEYLGTNSIRSQKDGNIYRVTGMISFGSIKIGDMSGSVLDKKNVLKPGEIGVQDYIEKVKEINESVPNADAIISSIEEELNNVAGTINRVTSMLETDQQIQYCINGRDLSQINGKKATKQDKNRTEARFPNLLNEYRVTISTAALKKAQDNYNKKLQNEIKTATKESSTDIAQYMCQMLPVTGGAPVGGTSKEQVFLIVPYAISYEVGAGLNNALLTQGGRGSFATTGATHVSTEQTTHKTTGLTGVTANILSGGVASGVDALASIGNGKVSYDIPGGTREMWATFNRETRICHLCSSVVSKDCKSESKRGFLGIGNKQEVNCTENPPVETCEDIPM